MATPSWLNALRHDTEDTWDWLAADDAEAHLSSLSDSLHKRAASRVLIDSETLSLCQRLLERVKPLAKIPLGLSRLEGAQPHAMVWTERQSPSQLLLTTEPFALPLLSIPSGQTSAQVMANLEPYIATEVTPTHPKRTRGFIGTEGILGLNARDLVALFSANPSAEALFWGSISHEDPWPEMINTAQLAALSGEASSFMDQHPERLWSMSFRSALSRSVLRLEDHDGILIMQVDYTPTTGASAPIVEALGARFQTHWPLDLPFDVLSILLGLYFETSDAVLSLLKEKPDREEQEMMLDMYSLGALKAEDLTLIEDLKPWVMQSENEAMQQTAADVALRHQLDGFLLWMLATPNLAPELRQALEERLS